MKKKKSMDNIRELETLLSSLKNAESFREFCCLLERISDINREIDTVLTIDDIQNRSDTSTAIKRINAFNAVNRKILLVLQNSCFRERYEQRFLCRIPDRRFSCAYRQNTPEEMSVIGAYEKALAQGNKNMCDENMSLLLSIRAEKAKQYGYRDFSDARDYEIRSWGIPDTVGTILFTEAKNRLTENIFPDGTCPYDIVPFEKAEENIACFLKMHEEEYYTLFKRMQMQNTLDAVSEQGDGSIEFTTYLAMYDLPYISMNGNAEHFREQNLVHELGHALCLYDLCRDVPFFALYPKEDISEFFAFLFEYIYLRGKGERYSEYFLKERRNLFFSSSLGYYFEYSIYKNTLSAKERKELFYSLCRELYPDVREDKMESYFYAQKHILYCPFYQYSYAVASLCILQIVEREKNNFSLPCFRDLLRICRREKEKKFIKDIFFGNINSTKPIFQKSNI